MIWNVKNSNGMKLVDAQGVHIKYAYEFNDETGEVKFYLTGQDVDGKTRAVLSGLNYYEGFTTVQASAVVLGAKMVPTERKELTEVTP